MTSVHGWSGRSSSDLLHVCRSSRSSPSCRTPASPTWWWSPAASWRSPTSPASSWRRTAPWSRRWTAATTRPPPPAPPTSPSSNQQVPLGGLLVAPLNWRTCGFYCQTWRRWTHDLPVCFCEDVYRRAERSGIFFGSTVFQKRNPWLCWWLYRSLLHKLSSSTDFVTLNFPDAPGIHVFRRGNKDGADPAFSEGAEPGKNLERALKKKEKPPFVCLFKIYSIVQKELPWKFKKYAFIFA